MVLYVDLARLAALQATGARWTVRWADLGAPELERLHGGTLYLATIVDDRVRVIGHLVDEGEVSRCDVDVSDRLERIGCAGVAQFASWARTARVLTPTDVDLLRYALGLPLDLAADPPPAPPALPTGFDHDPRALRLVAEIHREPHFDANRLVLADHLQERGDPRGELIALQLARARDGGPASEREHELLRHHRRTWAQPLAPFLTAYEFRRGFLAKAIVDDRVKMRAEIVSSPTWATVEDLETRNLALLLHSRSRALRRVAVTASELGKLAADDAEHTIEAIVGNTQVEHGRTVQGGVALPSEEHGRWRMFDVPALRRVREMSILADTETREHAVVRLMRTRLGTELDHLELFTPAPQALDLDRWRRLFDTGKPRRFGVRGIVDGWIAVVVIEWDATGRRIVLQLGDPMRLQLPVLTSWLPSIAVLGRGLRRITLDLVEPEARFAPAYVEPLVRELRMIFPDVETTSSARWRSP
jgi:uncharacterized protein (TIGR02996 family)